jgi:hypothetical protein
MKRHRVKRLIFRAETFMFPPAFRIKDEARPPFTGASAATRRNAIQSVFLQHLLSGGETGETGAAEEAILPPALANSKTRGKMQHLAV